MFEQSILQNGARTRRVWTVMVSVSAQVTAVCAALLIPLVAFERLPQVRLGSPPPRVPVSRPKPPDHVQIVPVSGQGTNDGRLQAPPTVPNGVSTAPEPARPTTPGGGEFDPPYIPGAPTDTTLRANDPVAQISRQAVPPPPRDPVVVKPPVKPPERITMGGRVMLAQLIRRPAPVYPPLARTARIEGTVKLQAIINRDGQIQDLTVLSGHPLLVKAALDAVRQWAYRPTTLNGDPVEVITTIDVIFNLTK